MGDKNDQLKEPVKFEDRLRHVCSSLFFCSQAYQELRTITTRYELTEANTLTQRPPFNFYRASLTYLLILEYCKIFNPDEANPRLSSLRNLWSDSCLLYPSINNKYHKSALKDLAKDELLFNIKELRNKRFAHSDVHALNKPFNIKAFTENELNQLGSHLNTAINIFNEIHKCALGSDLSFPHQSTGFSQTRSFIHEASIAMAFYQKNMTLAYQQGFQLSQQRIVPPYAPHK